MRFVGSLATAFVAVMLVYTVILIPNDHDDKDQVVVVPTETPTKEVIVIPKPGWYWPAPDGTIIITSCDPTFDGPVKTGERSEKICLMPGMTVRLKANFEPDLYAVIANVKDWTQSETDFSPRDAHFEGTSTSPELNRFSFGGIKFLDKTTGYFEVLYVTSSDSELARTWSFVSVNYR